MQLETQFYEQGVHLSRQISLNQVLEIRQAAASKFPTKVATVKVSSILVYALVNELGTFSRRFRAFPGAAPIPSCRDRIEVDLTPRLFRISGHFIQVTARRHHRADHELSAFRHVSKCSSLRLIKPWRRRLVLTPPLCHAFVGVAHRGWCERMGAGCIG